MLSQVLDSRAATPLLAPKGSSAACAQSGGCERLAPSAFVGANITVSGTAGATLYFSLDSCPVGTRTRNPLPEP